MDGLTVLRVGLAGIFSISTCCPMFAQTSWKAQHCHALATESDPRGPKVVVDDLVLISGAYYKVGSVLLRIKPDGKSFDEVWRSTALEIHWNTPVYHDGFLFAFSGRNEPDARFRCVEFKTGKSISVSFGKAGTWMLL